MNIRKPTKPKAKGFALVVTLTLMVLLTIIAIGLLTLANVSLRTSSQEEAGATARANARMALTMAIAQLQKEMGPDARISAPHDAGTSASGGQPHWTAVYDAWEFTPGKAEAPGTRKPNFRGWLTSGAGQAGGATDEISVVGGNSIGANFIAKDEVRVPLQAVTTGKKNGKLAWWTADESVKAKITAGPEDSSKSSFGNADSLFHAQSPPNIGHHAFPGLEKFDWEAWRKAKTISISAVSLAAELNDSSVGITNHHLTVHSAGVLADVRAGRLKRDLTSVLERPVEELEDKPFFLTDGRMNFFDITEDGDISNSSLVGGNSRGSGNEWGINLEELSLFQTLPSVLSWSGGIPALVTKSSREEVVRDRHFIYNKPTMEAAQFIFSLKAVSTGGDNYRMEMMLDGVVAFTNPNDVSLRVSPGLALPLQVLSVPYSLRLEISQASGNKKVTNTTARNLNVFKGYVEGGNGSVPAAGFTLEPGESAAFGSSVANGFDLNLRRGFVPSGGVDMTGWNLSATNLKKTDKVDFELQRSTAGAFGDNFTYYNLWIGPRIAGGGNSKGWQIDATNLAGSSLSGTLVDEMIPQSIKPSQVLTVNDFINQPRPILMLSFLRNVEQSSGAAIPDGFASRPNYFSDPATAGNSNLNTADLEAGRHISQMLVTADPMNYQFRTLAAGMGGRNVYHGGGRQPGLGGSFNVISRRIPMVAPLSLGAFQNAIAFGLVHINEGAMPAVGGDPVPSYAVAMSPHRRGGSIVGSKSIGNSFAPPFLSPNQIYRSGTGGTAATDTASDYSWMANTALWDSWFLSGIVDGAGANSSSLQTDSRSPLAQFRELAEGTGLLRNKRFMFHPHKSPDEAVKELFDGNVFKPSAVNGLSKYLLMDGAFNVNSTSAKAWEALLSGIRNLEILKPGGSSEKFDHPFGTLGYAVSTATSGTEGDWMGLRSLSDTEIKTLAKAIETEVISRGPFLSMSDFVNRRPDSSDEQHQAMGALQAAIDKSGLNDRLAAGGRKLSSNDLSPLPGSKTMDVTGVAPIRATGSAGHFSQGDLLTAIGSQITVRSDTFTIRAYGDARDERDNVLATAWCEVVVQRLPEYVDTIDDPEDQEGWPQPSDRLSPANREFGRRFVINSFRWLSGNEI